MLPRLLLAAAAFAAAPAFAQQGPQIRPGLWEMTLTGMKQTQKICFTPEMVKDMKSLSQQRTPDSDCKASGEAVSGNTRTFNVSCTKPNKYDAKISLTVNGPDNFTMTQNYTMERGGKGQSQSGTMSVAYRRLGDCPK
jgi:hypothetical protein